jgi:hypothetical protein
MNNEGKASLVNWLAVACCVLLSLRGITSAGPNSLFWIGVVFVSAAIVGLIASRVPGIFRFWGVFFLSAWMAGVFLLDA